MNEEKIMSEKQKEELVKMCKEIDPFRPISSRDQNFLREHGISNFADPYEFTKELLMLLDRINPRH
jgi:hypothetical protein